MSQPEQQQQQQQRGQADAGRRGRDELPPLAPLPPLVPPVVPQALVPIQYTRRVPTEVPSLDQAIRDALPGTIVLLARGTHQLGSPLMIDKQIRVKGEGSPSEVHLVCSGACGVLVDRGGYALLSSVTIHHVRASRGHMEFGEPAPGMACAVRVSGAGSRLLLDHCEVLADGIGVAATDDSRLDMQFTRVHDCKAHGVCVQSNAKACVEECCLESNAGSGIHADGATLEARRNTVCHNQHSGVQLLGRCCGSIKCDSPLAAAPRLSMCPPSAPRPWPSARDGAPSSKVLLPNLCLRLRPVAQSFRLGRYNKMYENRRKNVALKGVPWWARGSIKVLSNMS